MAPFGKNFLKARLKNRTKDADPVVGKEIQVTVCNEEKVVCGVTKHTTCADMIQALLEDHKSVPESKRLLHGEPTDFCLVERWKGFERALPPLTRILRLCYAWGDQRPFIHFTLVRNSDFVPHPAKRGGKPKSARPKRWDHSRTSTNQHHQSAPVERQKRIVKKAFRKLEKLHKESSSSPGAEEVDRMVQLILNQDRTIREQIQRMRELDLEIQRIAVQEQKEEEEEEEESSENPAAQSLDVCGQEQLQEYIYASDGVRHLEQQVQRHQELILQLSRDIEGELRRVNAPLTHNHDSEQEGAAAAAASWIPSESESLFAAEVEKLQEELRCSLLAGMSLHNQAAEMERQLKYYDTTLVSKDQECWQLAAHLSSLQVGEVVEEEEEEEEEPPRAASQGSGSQAGVQMLKLKHSLSPLDVTDTDSDTGISSTHSQDSLSPGLDFPPPLDTDV